LNKKESRKNGSLFLWAHEKPVIIFIFILLVIVSFPDDFPSIFYTWPTTLFAVIKRKFAGGNFS
jgi:hypothetical protein